MKRQFLGRGVALMLVVVGVLSGVAHVAYSRQPGGTPPCPVGKVRRACEDPCAGSLCCLASQMALCQSLVCSCGTPS